MSQEAIEQLKDANQRIANALQACQTLSVELTEERSRANDQAYQIDALATVLMWLMQRHRYEHLTIAKAPLIEIGKAKKIYFEDRSEDGQFFVEVQPIEIDYKELKQCDTETPGSSGETLNFTPETPESTTSHYEHNPNSEATALPS